MLDKRLLQSERTSVEVVTLRGDSDEIETAKNVFQAAVETMHHDASQFLRAEQRCRGIFKKYLSHL